MGCCYISHVRECLYLSGVLKCNIYVLLLLSESVTSNLISVQPCNNTRSSSMVTLARHPTRSSFKITNCSFRYAAPCLWNKSFVRYSHFRLSHMAVHHLHHLHSPLSSSLTRSVFHSELKAWLFGKSFPP